ncbi:MAG TPA: GNAT family N-acetyltransferase [Dehalococcoidia bacterium]|nr:GNAT family N-acetyltransferase [Dehalococcoidia bacterium]
MNHLADLTVFPLTAGRLEDFMGFDCGSEEWQRDLREFLVDDALSQMAGRYNKTYVFYAGPSALGFVTLSAAQVNRADIELPERAPYPVVPAVLVGRLGIDQSWQGRGYGQQIMALVRQWARELVAGCRVVALQVDVRNEGAIAFYEREGFEKAPIEIRRNMQWMFCDLGPDDSFV